MSRHNRTRRGPLPRPVVRPDDPTLTRFAGLIPLVAHMTKVLRLPSQLAELAQTRGRRRIHAVHHVLFAFVVGALAGTERLAHLEWLRDDIVLLKFLRLASWPVRKVFSAALAGLSDAGVRGLESLLGDIARRTLRCKESVVVDLDNTAIVDHGTAEGSKFGYCGKGRRRRRHYPIVASVAESLAVVAAQYRDGSEMTNTEVFGFIDHVTSRLRSWFGPKLAITLRGDGGFWSPGFAAGLQERDLAFVLGVHLVSQLKLMLMTATWEALTDDPDVEFTVLPSEVVKLGSGMRIIAVRRRVNDPGAPPSGKVIDWSPEWRYQAVITTEDWTAPDVWRFYNQRGDSERVFRIGKQALGLGNLVGHSYRANEVAFLLRLIAYNADLDFQQTTEAAARTRGAPVLHHGLEWRQRRFYNSPARLLREKSRWVLRTAINRCLTELWRFYAPDSLANGEVAAA